MANSDNIMLATELRRAALANRASDRPLARLLERAANALHPCPAELGCTHPHVRYYRGGENFCPDCGTAWWAEA